MDIIVSLGAIAFFPVLIWALLLWSRLQSSELARVAAGEAAQQEISAARVKSREEMSASVRALEEAEARLVKYRNEVEARARERLAQVDEELKSERSSIRAEAERAREHYEAELKVVLAELEPLRRFQSCADAEREAQATLAEGVQLAQQLRDQAEAFAAASKARTESEVREAAERLRKLRVEADAVLSKATEQARRIVDEANRKGLEVAGAAFTALQERDSLEGAVQAIRNVIDGYGDRYVVPTRSLLDDLAADFGHLEAGQHLKDSRDQSRRMVEESHAAECDYAETNRRETAIRFVIDAFNGRVDGILSRTKHDNFGTLEQEIRDAFSLVNLNGEAFRNARILPSYLDSRLSELKWAVIAQELKLREREEQRRIQEEIREEEKARREAERVIKETQKQEDLLQAALEKARAEVEAASAGERARLEARMEELKRQLSEAEAKNQRAKSMAEQTKAGNVYIISNVGSFGDGVLKIGMTRRQDPMDRIFELGDASVPFEFDVHAMIATHDAPTLERELHARFDERRVNRINYRKEFFRVTVAELREVVAQKGLEATFTMAAEAREYRETLALAERSGEKPAKPVAA